MVDEPVAETQSIPEDPNRAAARESWSEGEELAECPTCLSQKRAFLIIDGKCDSCRARDQQAVFPATTLGWPEVRQRRTRLLLETDFTHVMDFPEERRIFYTGWRQQLRDVTQQSDPMAAWRELDLLEATRPTP